MSQDQDGISLPVPCFGACPGRESLDGESSRERSAGGASGIPAAGTFWQDPMIGSGGGLSPTERSPMDGGGLLSTGKSCKSRPVTVAYVVNGEASLQNHAESMALQCLKDACEAAGSRLETVNFGKLDFGETTVLDRFYNAGESCEKFRRLERVLDQPCKVPTFSRISVLPRAQACLHFWLISSVGSKVTPLLPRL